MPVPHTGPFKCGIEGGGSSPDMFSTPTTQEPLAKSDKKKHTRFLPNQPIGKTSKLHFLKPME